VRAGAAFVLTDLMSVSAVVAHDGGVRLICAGWAPQDDDSDVNGTAVYSRASLGDRYSNRLVAHRFFASLFTHRADSPAIRAVKYSMAGDLLHGGQRPAPAGQFAGDRDVGH
jgi:hypothetical protein